MKVRELIYVDAHSRAAGDFFGPHVGHQIHRDEKLLRVSVEVEIEGRPEVFNIQHAASSQVPMHVVLRQAQRQLGDAVMSKLFNGS